MFGKFARRWNRIVNLAAAKRALHLAFHARAALRTVNHTNIIARAPVHRHSLAANRESQDARTLVLLGGVPSWDQTVRCHAPGLVRQRRISMIDASKRRGKLELATAFPDLSSSCGFSARPLAEPKGVRWLDAAPAAHRALHKVAWAVPGNRSFAKKNACWDDAPSAIAYPARLGAHQVGCLTLQASGAYRARHAGSIVRHQKY